jgi:CheY-like chemotaxis protein
MRMTVVVVDDHPGFRELARAFLTGAGYEVVADAADGRSALEAVSAHRPDVVLLDVRLHDIDGFEVARRLAAEPEPPVIVLVSSRDETDYAGRLAASGARAFITKSKLTRRSLEAALAS